MRTKIFWYFDFEEIWNINDNMGVMRKSVPRINSACASLRSQVPSHTVAGKGVLPALLLLSQGISRPHWTMKTTFCHSGVQGLLSFKHTSIRISSHVTVKIREFGESTWMTSVKWVGYGTCCFLFTRGLMVEHLLFTEKVKAAIQMCSCVLQLSPL